MLFTPKTSQHSVIYRWQRIEGLSSPAADLLQISQANLLTVVCRTALLCPFLSI